jgi:predicted phage-related endonuclease
VVGAVKIAAESSSASIIALRHEIAANSAANGATLERAMAVMTTMAQFLAEFEADAKAQVDVLRHALHRTDATVRDFADLILKSTSDIAVETGRLRDMLPAMQAGAESLAKASERIVDIAEDIDARRAARTWKTAG